MTTPEPTTDGIAAIAHERIRQIEKGYTREHDAQHGPIEIIDAALAYVVQAQDRLSEAAGKGVGSDGPETYWPWGMESFKASDDELRSLAKAGALLAAAYEAAAAQRAAGES